MIDLPNKSAVAELGSFGRPVRGCKWNTDTYKMAGLSARRAAKVDPMQALRTE